MITKLEDLSNVNVMFDGLVVNGIWGHGEERLTIAPSGTTFGAVLVTQFSCSNAKTWLGVHSICILHKMIPVVAAAGPKVTHAEVCL